MATVEKTVHVEMENVGPVKRIAIDVPRAGVVVWKGRNGAGKTTLLNALDAVGRGTGKPPITDGEDRAEIRLGDVTLRVGKRNQRTGEPEFEMLDGRYSIADLIAPGFKSRESCDAHAIKTLAQLAGSGDVSLFYELAGGQEAFEELVPAEVAGDNDVVALAGRIERALQRKAKTEEDAAAGADGKADAYSASASQVDTSGPHDEHELAESRSFAERECGRLEQKAADAEAKLRDARAAQDALEDAEAETDGPSIEDATATLAQARGLVTERLAVVTQLEQQLRNARTELQQAESAVREAETVLTSAQNTAKTLAKFRATVEAARNVEIVSPEELAKARAAVNATREAELRGRDIRKALEAREQAESWRKRAAEHRKAADRLRQAAAATDDVLSGLVGKLGSPLFVERGRLLINTDRGKESFWDLSDGERSELAVTVFANAIRQHNPGKDCQLTLPQSFWEGLDFNGRKRIAELMERQEVLAWTAECSRDQDDQQELHAEVYR
jgi:energy-coupling factor transporter ATP-binding protein EcfA2